MNKIPLNSEEKH